MRLNKFLSASGVASRRDAEKIIAEGRVMINGQQAHHPGQQVEETDVVLVDGAQIKQHETTRVWLYYKPVGLITTHKDPEGRPTVFDNLPKKLPHVVSVGRLDINSEGLLLLTNSPSFSHFAENPTNEWKRTYRVRIYGDIDESQFASLQKGITIDGIRYKPNREKMRGY
jgi:23S rRNA pseudouridine2605 synthase